MPHLNLSPPKHILVFIPGFMGSQLRSRSTGETIWLDIPHLLGDPIHLPEKLYTNLQKLKYPNDDLVADRILDQILFLPPLFKQDEYGRFTRTLSSWGYTFPGKNTQPGQKPAYLFPYDWRQDNRESARQLAASIDVWRAKHPGAQVWIIAHSNGGMVARWYIENEGGKDYVSRLFLIGSPWDGAPKTLRVLLEGVDWFILRSLNRFGLQKLIHDAALTFPSFYQLIPGFLPFLKDQQGQVVNIFKDPVLPENDLQTSFIRSAETFNHELGTGLSVETLCFFGINQPTTSQGIVERSPENKQILIKWQQSEEGDGTIPVHSAIHPMARERLPFSASHGDLYSNRPLLDKLHFELISRYRYGLQASPPVPKYQAQLLSDLTVYAPGEMINVRVNLKDQLIGTPVENAQVQYQILLRQRAPVSGIAAVLENDSTDLPFGTLEPCRNLPGEFSGNMIAPALAGYYQISIRFTVSDEPPLEIKDLFLIDSFE